MRPTGHLLINRMEFRKAQDWRISVESGKIQSQLFNQVEAFVSLLHQSLLITCEIYVGRAIKEPVPVLNCRLKKLPHRRLDRDLSAVRMRLDHPL